MLGGGYSTGCGRRGLDITWVLFVGVNLLAMREMGSWSTIPFLVIWVSLTLVYGWRMWRLQPAILTVALVTLATGGIIVAQVVDGQQEADYLVEVPLVALMFLAMVWHGRRRQAASLSGSRRWTKCSASRGRTCACSSSSKCSSSMPRTSLARRSRWRLGHAGASSSSRPPTRRSSRTSAWSSASWRDRRRLSSRLLLLASAGSPGFLDLAPVGVDSIVIEALDRWGYTPRRWRLGEVAEATVPGDRDRLAVALDALLENAIAHTDKDDLIELSARAEDGHVVLAVADSGCGIAETDLKRIFGRFARATPYRSRETGGFGLGLPTAAAIAEAHHGSVRANSALGKGSTFELLLFAAPALNGNGKLVDL